MPTDRAHPEKSPATTGKAAALPQGEVPLGGQAEAALASWEPRLQGQQRGDHKALRSHAGPLSLPVPPFTSSTRV